MSASPPDIRRFFRHSTIYAVGNAVNRLGAFLLLPIYTHYLTVAQYGELELFYVVSAVASGLLSIGIAHATLRFYFDYAEPADRHAVVSTNLLASFAITAAGVLPVAYFADALAAALFAEPGMAVGVHIILATVVLELSSQVGLAYLRATERSLFFVAVSVGKLLVQVAVNAVLVVGFGAGVIGVLAGNLATVAIGWVVLTAFTVRHCGLAFSWGKLLPILKYSYPFLLSTIVGLVSANVDRLLINGFLDLRALGLYALAIKFSKLIADLIGEPFSQAYGAFRFTLMGKDNAADIQARIVRYLLAATCFAALGLSWFVDAVLRVMSAPEFWEAARYVPILAAAAVIRVVTYPLQTGILYGKHTRHIFYIGVAQAVVNAAGGLLLIWWLGLVGACLTVLLSSAVAAVLSHRVSQRYFHVVYPHGRLALVAGVTLAFYAGSLPLVTLTGPVGGFVAKLLLLALYVLVLWRLALTTDERAEAGAMVARKWRSRRSGA